MLLKSEQSLLRSLFDSGVFAIDMINGFAFTEHEENPNAPRSPLKIQLRTPPNGNLSDEQVASLAQAIYVAVLHARIPYDAIAGIPKAGVALAKEFQKIHARVSGKKIPILYLKKKVSGVGTRSFFVRGKDHAKTRDHAFTVLLIDDVVTEARNKLKAQAAFKRAGHRVSGIGIYMDWEKSGGATLRRSLPVASAMPITKALKFLLDDGRISHELYTAVERYRRGG